MSYKFLKYMIVYADVYNVFILLIPLCWCR